MKQFNLKAEQLSLDVAYKDELRQVDLAQWQPGLDNLGESELMCLVATLQLAMRHPVFPSRPTGQWCKAFIERLLRSIPEKRPALRRLMEAGNNPAYDEIKAPARHQSHG